MGIMRSGKAPIALALLAAGALAPPSAHAGISPEEARQWHPDTQAAERLAAETAARQAELEQAATRSPAALALPAGAVIVAAIVVGAAPTPRAR